MQRVCVFCGSSPGRDPIFVEAAEGLGRALAHRGLELVYGGAHVGLMGRVADAALAAGGRVVGVIPRSMVEREIAHSGLSELRIVSSMHERKALMEQLSDGFVALPGGIGTFEEICEIFTWQMLGLHAKPCALMNVRGYYEPLLQLLDNAVDMGFLRPAQRAMVLVEEGPEALLERFATYDAPAVEKWLTREVT